MKVTRQFVNEHAREIKITIEGPGSMSENTLTEMEARHLRDALSEALQADDAVPFTDADKRRQAKQCGCRGADDLCPCQNVRIAWMNEAPTS